MKHKIKECKKPQNSKNKAVQMGVSEEAVKKPFIKELIKITKKLQRQRREKATSYL